MSRLGWPVAAALALLAGCGGGSQEEARAAGSEAGTAPEVHASSVQVTESAAQTTAAQAFLHGRVLDRASARGVPALHIELSDGDTRVLSISDERGEFTAGEALPAGKYRVRVRLAAGGEELIVHPLRIDHDPREVARTSHVLHVDVGPSCALRFSEAATLAPERWEARIVERNALGEDREWAWRRLLAGDPPLLRYARVEHAPDPEFHARVELRMVDGDWFGRAPLRTTSSVDLQEVPLRLVQYAAFGGIVVDGAGRVVPRADVRLRQESGESLPVYRRGWRRARSDEAGEFGFEQVLEPGRYHVRVLAEGRPRTDFDLLIGEGGLVGYVLRVAELETGGILRGHIAPWIEGEPPVVVLVLASADGLVERVLHPMQEPAAHSGARFADSADGGLDFEFEALPAGEYELALFALDGVDYRPATATLTVPGEPLRIRAPEQPVRALVAFDVGVPRGATPLESYEVIFRAPGWWNPEGHRLAPGAPVAALPLDSAVTWMLWAPGYRPRYGDVSDFVAPSAERGEGPRSAQLELEPGWGAELWFRKSGARGAVVDEDTYSAMARVRARRPLEGVRVLADGLPVGESDADGVVRLALDARPARLDFVKPGWSALETSSYTRGRLVDPPGGELRCALIWMQQR